MESSYCRARLSLPTDEEILIVREFRAGPASVFDAWSKPEHVRRWYGCEDQTFVVCEIDFREGGRWRWVLRDPSGGWEHGFSGEYLTIARPNRLVFTQRYEPVPGSDHLVTLTFEEGNGATTMHMLIRHASKQGRDAHLQSGMEVGLQDMMVRLETLLASLEAA